MKRNEKIINGLILFICTFATFAVLIHKGELKGIGGLFAKTNFWCIGFALILMFLYIALSGLIIRKSAHAVGEKMTVIQGVFISFVGQYYSLITPFASGGQPFQIYNMNRKYKISVANGTSITVQKCLVYQIVVPLMLVLAYLVQYTTIKEQFGGYRFIIVISILLNCSGTVAVFIIIKHISWLTWFVDKAGQILKRFKLFKKFDSEKINHIIMEYDEAIQDMKKNKSLMISTTIYTILQMICYFSISYFVLMALGTNKYPFILIFCMQIIVYSLIAYIPTPGNAGASESGFYIIFGALLSKNIVVYCMLLWRLITYYIPIVVSGIIVWISYGVGNKGKESKVKKSYGTN